MFNLFSFNRKSLGIDLGTANILITLKDKGIILNMPSVVALDSKTKNLVAIGDQAKEMIGRCPATIMPIRPLKDGVIADLSATTLMLENIISQVRQKYSIGKPLAVVGIPSGITQVEEKALEEALLATRCSEVYLIEEPMAAAIGSGLNISSTTGSMIIDIGGGTTEVAVITLGGVVASSSIKVAGDEFNENIIKYMKKEKNIAIGYLQAEELKIQIGCASPLVTELSCEIKARELTTGLPKNITITSEDIRKAIEPSINKIIDAVMLTLEKTPPEFSSDIIENGIVLAGGGALIRNLDKLISERTKVAVFITSEPLDAVVNGTYKVISDFDKYKTVLRNYKR